MRRIFLRKQEASSLGTQLFTSLNLDVSVADLDKIRLILDKPSSLILLPNFYIECINYDLHCHPSFVQ
jgi:hypothetical protein